MKDAIDAHRTDLRVAAAPGGLVPQAPGPALPRGGRRPLRRAPRPPALLRPRSPARRGPPFAWPRGTLIAIHLADAPLAHSAPRCSSCSSGSARPRSPARSSASRLQGYRATSTRWTSASRVTLTTPKKVAVIGGGVAGLTAAVTLARRGYAVTLFEKNAYLGGKLGSWEVELAPGRKTWVSHGFHAFFPHYWNLNRFLDSLDLRRDFKSIGDYVIIGPHGEKVTFADLDRTPVFNLLSLARAGVFSIGETLKAPGRDLYGILLEYDGDEDLREVRSPLLRRLQQAGAGAAAAEAGLQHLRARVLRRRRQALAGGADQVVPLLLPRAGRRPRLRHPDAGLRGAVPRAASARS